VLIFCTSCSCMGVSFSNWFENSFFKHF